MTTNLEEIIRKALLFDLKDIEFKKRLDNLIKRRMVDRSTEVFLRAKKYDEKIKQLREEVRDKRNKTFVKSAKTFVITFQSYAQYHHVLEAVKLLGIKKSGIVLIWKDKDEKVRVLLKNVPNAEKVLRELSLRDNRHEKNLRADNCLIHVSRNSIEWNKENLIQLLANIQLLGLPFGQGI
jgi:hypothetical protein